MYRCVKCLNAHVPAKRWQLGYRSCLSCGDRQAKTRVFTVACGSKQGYELIADPRWLKQLNPKYGNI